MKKAVLYATFGLAVLCSISFLISTWMPPSDLVSTGPINHYEYDYTESGIFGIATFLAWIIFGSFQKENK